ncbi:MAG: formylglycine-generating enzyme family protein, partial [Clostridia bacterium]|nr:formylglycine-generating enzyme family protein [Clostridia bacterium]
LLFGIQWDLTLKFIEEKGAKTQEELKTDSTEWGNYSNSAFDITRGYYTTAPTTSGSWNRATGTSKYTKPASTSTLLTTGATDRNSVLGIYDLAGNVREWTLERRSNTTSPCVGRGALYLDNGSSYPSVNHYNTSETLSSQILGMRVALW